VGYLGGIRLAGLEGRFKRFRGLVLFLLLRPALVFVSEKDCCIVNWFIFRGLQYTGKIRK
jgi:hypothetical protein